MSKEIWLTWELKVKLGKAEELATIVKEMVPFNKNGEPKTTVYNVYFNEERANWNPTFDTRAL